MVHGITKGAPQRQPDTSLPSAVFSNHDVPLPPLLTLCTPASQDAACTLAVDSRSRGWEAVLHDCAVLRHLTHVVDAA